MGTGTDVAYVRQVRWEHEAGSGGVDREMRAIVILLAVAAVPMLFVLRTSLPGGPLTMLLAFLLVLAAGFGIYRSAVRWGRISEEREKRENAEGDALAGELISASDPATMMARLLNTKPDLRYAAAMAWLIRIDESTGAGAAVMAITEGSDPVEFDGRPYAAYLRLALAFASYLTEQGWDASQATNPYGNPFLYLLLANGYLTVRDA